MTRGVQHLGLSPSTMHQLFSKANELRGKSYFLTFEPHGSNCKISDGNGKPLGTVSVILPVKIWILFDDYGDRFVATALLPEEY